MKYLKLVFVLGFAVLGLSACATTQNTVEHRLSDQEALVTVGSDNLNPGDRVKISGEQCKDRPFGGGRNGGGSSRQCSKKELGTGEVLRLLPDGEAIVRVPQGIALRTGLLVEKVQ